MRISGSFVARSAFAAIALLLFAAAPPARAQTPQIGIDSNLAENQEVITGTVDARAPAAPAGGGLPRGRFF